MKKLVCILLVALMVASVGCGGGKEEIKPNTPNVGETAGKVEVPGETPEEPEGPLSLTISPKPMDIIAVGETHVVCVRKDGTVVSTDWDKRGECLVSDWTDVVKVRAAYGCTVGLRKDGTMLANGIVLEADHPMQAVLSWTDIVDFDLQSQNIAALKSDGTVIGIRKGTEQDYSEWTRVVKVATSSTVTVGLRDDGTILYSGGSGKGYDEAMLTSWTDIVDVDIHEKGVIALKKDGTVVAYDKDGQVDTSSWQNVVEVCAAEYHMFAIAEDGTVYSNTDVAKDWTDVVAIDSKGLLTAALRADGTLIATEINFNYFNEEFAEWTNIGVPE